MYSSTTIPELELTSRPSRAPSEWFEAHRQDDQVARESAPVVQEDRLYPIPSFDASDRSSWHELSTLILNCRLDKTAELDIERKRQEVRQLVDNSDLFAHFEYFVRELDADAAAADYHNGGRVSDSILELMEGINLLFLP